MPTNTYPLAKFHFLVDWGGERVGFTEVTGLDMQVEPIEYREGNSPEFSKTKMPGMRKFSNLTLKRGSVALDTDFYKWVKSIGTKDERRNVTIKLLDESHNPVLAWTAKNAFPIKLQASDLKADGNEVAIETLELAHEGLTLLE